MTADTDTAQRLIEAARRAGADAADVLVLGSASVAIGVAGGVLEEAERSENAEAGLRVFIGRRQACVAASDLSDAALVEMAERAVAMAAAAPEDPWCGLSDPAERGVPGDVAGLDLIDPAAPPTPQLLEDTARAAETAALSVAGVRMVEHASASWGEERITLATSDGFTGSYRRSTCGIGVSAIAGEGSERERDHAAEIRRHWSDLPGPEGIGRLAAERAVAALGPQRPPSGRFPVMFDERVAGGIIGHILGAINGAAIARGASWLADRMGQPILPAGLDITEDPLIARGRASRPFDAEAIAARPRRLVGDGVLESWVLDCGTARKLGLATTGNARRGTSGPPSPGTGNIRLTPGTRSRQDLLREMGRGLLVTSLIGSSINPTTGAYSRGCSGFWVEGGEIAFPVNEITIAGSLPQMIRTLVLADDADPEKAVSVPSLLLDGLTIGA